MSDTRFHIIVPTFRRPDDLSVLLDLLMPQLDDAPDARLTVVNDGSHSRAYQKVIAAWGDRLAYIPLDDNTGIIGARLAGISQTTEDYIVFTDDDCRPGPHWVAKVRAAVTAYPNADIIAGRTEIVQDRPRWHDSLWHDLPNATPGPVAPFGVLATAVTANAIFRRWVFDGVTAPDIRMRHFPDDYYLTQ
ncbi:MAG: glycosyltransferase family 2 protein, partial [Pseudomonadota bacterium]